MLTLQLLFWISCGIIAYCYVGYPIVLGSLVKILPQKKREPQPLAAGEWPKVSLVIAAYKEESMILQRIANALQMDYPADKLEVIIGVDGQEDLTGELVKTVGDSRIKLLQFPQRRGKPSVLNDCLQATTGSIVAFSDANTFWEPDAMKLIVRHFQHENIGGVCGQLILTDAVTGKNADGLYWKYENCLKRWEGQIGALLGFNGAIYAIRRELWEPIPPHTIVDDFLIGMRIHEHGRQVVFEERAVANEETAPSIQAEFQRRARIGAGGFQSLMWLKGLLSPRYGQVAFAFWSHKVLRWLCPLFMASAALANIALAATGSPLYVGLLILQGLFYTVALVGRSIPGNHPVAKLLRLNNMFVSMNAALAVGFWRWANKTQKGTWTRTARSQETTQKANQTSSAKQSATQAAAASSNEKERQLLKQ